MPTTDARWHAVVEVHRMDGPEWEQEKKYQPLRAPGEVLGMKCVEPDCDGLLHLMWSDRVERYWYSCTNWPRCKGSMPAQIDGSPRGEPRTREVQEMRVKTHEIFDVLWKERHCSRNTAYAWFRRVMVLPPYRAHIYKQDVEGCEKLIALVAEKGPGTEFWKSWYRHGKRVRPKKKQRCRE